MRTKNDSLILKTTFWVFANHISCFENYSYEQKNKTRFEAKLTNPIFDKKRNCFRLCCWFVLR